MSVHSISNNNLSISINSLGAELTSLKHDGAELLWQSDKNVWLRYAPVLFPVVGKLKDNLFKYRNVEYKLSQHGFARDLEFSLIRETNNILEFELTANEETMIVYPFHFSLRITFELERKGLKINYNVFNPDKNDLLFSIGAHPGFNCKRTESESLNNFYLEFDNKNELTIEKLSDGLLSGETTVVKIENGRLLLNSKLFENDALVFKNNQIEKVKLGSTKSKKQININCKGWPYFGIWTKKGSDSFVCLEPWFGIADSIKSKQNLEAKEGIMRLQPYTKWECNFDIEVN